ncbi:hypothetical protein C8F04DRAFT_1189943 [Mycena alexandri]|uniref:Uncharacterized protein n=1 Tax=Mycena alexandri TaxID=1745969 RepID=A0AAD6SKA8_9AGAR|nr:hypothetical protein C8F04DRAFT_1189943 [Mycena alexandri]
MPCADVNHLRRIASNLTLSGLPDVLTTPDGLRLVGWVVEYFNLLILGLPPRRDPDAPALAQHLRLTSDPTPIHFFFATTAEFWLVFKLNRPRVTSTSPPCSFIDCTRIRTARFEASKVKGMGFRGLIQGSSLNPLPFDVKLWIHEPRFQPRTKALRIRAALRRPEPSLTRAKILRRAHLARRSCGGAAAVTRRFNFLNSADRVLEWTYPHQNSEGCTHRLVVCNDHRVGVNASTYLEINAKKENLDAAVDAACLKNDAALPRRPRRSPNLNAALTELDAAIPRRHYQPVIEFNTSTLSTELVRQSMAYRQVVHIGAVSYPGHAQYLGTVLAPLAAQRPRTLQK